VRSFGSTGPAIRMTFSRESWVEVRDRDGNVIFGQLNPEGSIRVVRGQPPFSLVVGNASGVSLTYNGKTVDLTPHTRTDVARLTLE
jgi:cytoskeleton protein RodZ